MIPAVTKLESANVAKLKGSAITFRQNLLSWYDANARSLPWRLDWLKYHSPYHIWLSEIMLQQTVIKAVLASYQRFLEQFPDVYRLAMASEEEVRLAARGLGYYRRFRYLHQAAQQLCQGKTDADQVAWPYDFRSWKKLPGVGDYTAAAIASIAFGEAVPVVDGNVERVFCRLLDIRTAPNLPALKRLFFSLGGELIDQNRPGDYNQAVMELGQTHCTKQNPDCKACPLQSMCLAFQNSSQALAPQIKSQPIYQDIALELFIAKARNRVALVERPQAAKFLKGSWGFPTFIQDETKRWRWDGQSLIETSKVWRARAQKQGSFRHAITKHRLSVTVYKIELKAQAELKQARWLRLEEIESGLVANLDRKAWNLLTTE